MKSKNLNIEHDFIIVKREKEIIITTSDGVEIATLTVDTMTRSAEFPTLPSVPTKNFYLVFEPAGDKLDKNIATVWVEGVKNETK